ncbi:MAG: nitrogen regulation protein NR(II) [Thermodesulfobacteriota bacterium]
MALFENIIDGLNEGLIAVDRSLRITVFNHAAEGLTGIPCSLTIGKSIATVVEKDGWLVDLARKSMVEKKVFVEYEGKLHIRLGPPAQVVGTASPLFNDLGMIDGAILLLKELSGVRLLETDSTRRDRLALIGTFAAGIAHEIKNPLGGIKGAAQLLARKLNSKELLEYTDVIVRETDRLNDIIDNILNFANPRKRKLKPLNIYKVLDAAINMVSCSHDRSIYLEYDPSLPAIFGNREQLMQVFINLLKNAVEAVDKGGKVWIRTRMVTDFHLAEPGSKGRMMASITVKDNGCGIAPNNLDKLFTPFFTTKKKGTGLGIAIAFRIVKEHGGFLSVESSPGEGTEVSVYLPIGEE